LRAFDIVPEKSAPSKFPEINNFCGNSQARASLGVGFTADADIDIDNMDAYTGIKSFVDNRSDAGFFEGSFTLRTEDMASLRTFLIRDNRGGVIIPASGAGVIINNIPGIGNLFGPRRSRKDSFNVRITEFTDMGMKKLDLWQIKMKIVEEI
jgi:hypothetical protein